MENKKGILYTTYLGNIKNLDLDSDTEFIIIMRKLPKNFDLKKCKEINYKQELSPSEDLLFEYISNKNWNQFKKKFRREMLTRLDLRKAIESIYFKLRSHNVCLICCEEDYIHCHRYLLAEWYIKKGFTHIEIKQKN